MREEKVTLLYRSTPESKVGEHKFRADDEKIAIRTSKAFLTDVALRQPIHDAVVIVDATRHEIPGFKILED